MSHYTICISNIAPDSNNKVIRWCLDVPQNQFVVSADELSETGLLLKGWVLTDNLPSTQLVVSSGSAIAPLPIEKERPDVVNKLINDDSDKARFLKCGFRTVFTPETDFFQIGLLENEKFRPLIDITIKGALDVLKGSDKWLFLDNDSNQSVEQFTGKLKLTRIQLKQWKLYFSTLEKLGAHSSVHYSMLIAPSKEMVYPEYYPLKRAKTLPSDKVMSSVPYGVTVSIPIEQLKSAPYRTYRVCDTHWNHLGAFEASLVTASLHNKNIEDLRSYFAKDKYKVRMVGGDLGNKLFPIQKHNEKFLTSFKYKDYVVFDNRLPNFGRVIVIYYPDALYDEVLLLLGSSSSYTMFNYLSRIYRKVVFFHCAGNIDPDFVKKITPDYVVAQTNARFVIKPPVASDNFLSYIKRKVTPAANRKTAFIDKNVLQHRKDKKLLDILSYLKELNQKAKIEFNC